MRLCENHRDTESTEEIRNKNICKSVVRKILSFIIHGRMLRPALAEAGSEGRRVGWDNILFRLRDLCISVVRLCAA